MKKNKIGLLLLCIALSVCVTASAQKNKMESKIYAFGMAASFNDSLVYFTDIQEIDSVYLVKKTGFLVSRELYSNQLRDFLLEKKHEENRTCIFSFSPDRKKIEKKYLKMKSRYTKKGDFDVKYLTSAEFRFNAIKMSSEEGNEDEIVEKKNGSKKEKKQKKK